MYAIRSYYAIIFVLTAFPNKLSNEIFLPKNFVANFFQIISFDIIYRNKYSSIITEKVSSQFQAWVHNVQPVGMITSSRTGIRSHFLAFTIELSRQFKIVFYAILKIILINEVIPCIVRWSYNFV